MMAFSPVRVSWQKATCSWPARSVLPMPLSGVVNTCVTVVTLPVVPAPSPARDLPHSLGGPPTRPRRRCALQAEYAETLRRIAAQPPGCTVREVVHQDKRLVRAAGRGKALCAAESASGPPGTHHAFTVRYSGNSARRCAAGDRADAGQGGVTQPRRAGLTTVRTHLWAMSATESNHLAPPPAARRLWLSAYPVPRMLRRFVTHV